LINLLWDTCSKLSKSEAIATIFGGSVLSDQLDRAHALFFPTQLTFVVSHEFTHHVHGHLLPKNSDSMFPNEILDGGIGDLKAQALEIDADGYAVYHVLAHLISGDRRSQAVEMLGYQKEHHSIQDQALLSSFVVAVGAFLHALPSMPWDSSTVYKRRHPPQAARMNFIMQFAVAWCKQNRPELVDWITIDRFQMLMSAGAAISQIGGRTDWSAQTTFLQSEDGSEYVKKLDRGVKAHISSL
jgi:hypothetical protein